MARLFADENYPKRVVEWPNQLGHDAVTLQSRGLGGIKTPDEEVLRLAAQDQRSVLPINRRHFISLHRRTVGQHEGIIVCSEDQDREAFARRVNSATQRHEPLRGKLIRVNLLDFHELP